MRTDLLQDLSARHGELPELLNQAALEQGLELPGDIQELLGQLFSPPETPFPTPYLDRLAQANGTWPQAGGPPFPVNVYPFGVATTQVYPAFLGVCAGETTLLSSLDEVHRYCKQARKHFPPEQQKTVVLVTDKWNGPQFHRHYELAFLRHALEAHILFVFFLVTDYGVTRIPFLARTYRELEDLCQRHYKIESQHPEVVALDRLKASSPCLFAVQSGTWGLPGSPYYVEARYEFDFRAGRCTLYSASQPSQEKTIPPAAARRFARRAYEACHTREPDQDQRYRTVDAGHCSAQVFGLSFQWDALGDQFLSPACRTLSAAFRDLIDSLMD